MKKIFKQKRTGGNLISNYNAILGMCIILLGMLELVRGLSLRALTPMYIMESLILHGVMTITYLWADHIYMKELREALEIRSLREFIQAAIALAGCLIGPIIICYIMLLRTGDFEVVWIQGPNPLKILSLMPELVDDSRVSFFVVFVHMFVLLMMSLMTISEINVRSGNIKPRKDNRHRGYPNPRAVKDSGHREPVIQKKSIINRFRNDEPPKGPERPTSSKRPYSSSPPPASGEKTVNPIEKLQALCVQEFGLNALDIIAKFMDEGGSMSEKLNKLEPKEKLVLSKMVSFISNSIIPQDVKGPLKIYEGILSEKIVPSNILVWFYGIRHKQVAVINKAKQEIENL